MIRCINYDIPLLHWIIWYVSHYHHITSLFGWGKVQVFISLSSSAGLRYWSSLGFSPVSPTSAPLAADWSGAFSGAVVLWCRVDGFTKGTRDGHVVGKGGGQMRDSEAINWKMMKGESKERDFRQTAWLPLNTHYIIIYIHTVMDFYTFVVGKFLQCGWSLGPWAGQPSAPRKCTIQTDQVWKINPWKEVGTFQSASSQRVS